MTIPAEIVKLLDLNVGDQLEVSYDPSSRKITVSKAVSMVSKTGAEVLYVLEKTGAYLKDGHYKLASGKHSSRYVHVRLALASEDYARKFAEIIIKFLRGTKFDVVAAFTVGGILLAKMISKLLDAKLVIGEKKEKEVLFWNLDKIEKGDSILLVDDVLTTGGSLWLAIKSLKANSEGILKGLSVVVDRSKGMVDLGIRTVSLVSINFEEYHPDACPLCMAKIPLTDLSKAESDRVTTLSTIPKGTQPLMEKAYDDVEKLLEDARREVKKTR
jgi:orotate phosphoribosyltransferase